MKNSTPRATYRFQFHRGFPFREATRLVDYLQGLGVSTVYSSPILKAQAGSVHGYDVVDPRTINPELGGEEEFRALSEALQARGMTLILDIVPNHMCLSSENPWLWDVLAHGAQSSFAPYFAIDWSDAGTQVVLPILGESLEESLARKEFSVEGAGPDRVLRYYDWKLPLREAPAGSQEDLRSLIDAQAYRLVGWREGSRLRNYRRFFDIDQLIAVNVENVDVFEALHAVPFRLYREGLIHGLRVDHVDGLKKPTEYLQRLDARLRELRPERRADVWVEKILNESEEIPATWPIRGTTGYEFLTRMNDLWIDWDRIKEFERIYAEAAAGRSPARSSFFRVETRAKTQVLTDLFASEFSALQRELEFLAGALRPEAGLKPEDLREALAQLSVHLPVYRTYFSGPEPTEQDWSYLSDAYQSALSAMHGENPALNFLRELFTARPVDPIVNFRVRSFIFKWQQFTGPLMAKGHEDTALYRYNRLLALNEVGGNPGKSSFTTEELHRFNSERQLRFPLTLNASSTHDTKRSEDVRSRLAVLSEIPERWEEQLRKCFALNAVHKATPETPSHNQEIFIYQTLLGVWPLDGRIDQSFRTRMKDYFVKAAKEAKVSTNWLAPSEAFEQGLTDFVDAILDPERSPVFLREFQAFSDLIAYPGAVNSLGLTVLKATSPGIPDYYQGTELWDFSLVDPDNRRPVDFGRRSELMAPPPRAWAELLSQWRTGEVKWQLIRALNALRARWPQLFEASDYRGAEITGTGRENFFAFYRRYKNLCLVVSVSRLGTLRTAEGVVPPAAKIRLPENMRGEGFTTWQDALDPTRRPFSSPEEALSTKDLLGTLPWGIAVSQGT